MATKDQITLPVRINELLHRDRTLHASVILTIANFEIWLQDNKLVFFPEYTDHGPNHIREVIETASSLIRDDAWEAMSPADVATIVLSSLLHDCAMQLSEDGFKLLVTGGYTSESLLPTDRPWPVIWNDYLSEASRFDGRTLVRLFGDLRPCRRPPDDSSEWTLRDKLLIGDFLRRHHPRLAHEIAMWGVPGPLTNRLRLADVPNRLMYISGLTARSHGMDLRAAAELLPNDERREYAHVHAPFVMGVLRIADYIQIQATRAPGQVLMVRSLRSPVSRGEWDAHAAIEAITATHDDPEALFVKAVPSSASQFVKLRGLLDSIQSELDATWAVIGEIYGRFAGLARLGLTVRRIRSNMDDLEMFASTVTYLPRLLRFETTGADLLKLMVTPLYGADPSIGVRELVQNALDAVRERRDLPDTQAPPGEGSVTVEVLLKAERPMLTVRDNGIGMTADVIAQYFLRAGASFRNSEVWRSAHVDDSGHSRVLRSGRFGVGALAAFLLGDEMLVTTRHVHADSALQFSATIDTDVVDVRWTTAPVGTSITIPLAPAAAQALESPAASDWYCLADPLVARRIDGISADQATEWPSAGAVLPAPWRRIRHSDYTDIQWSCWLGRQAPLLAVNGIIVVESHRSSRYHSPPSNLTEWEYEPNTLTVRTPRLSVFDPDSNLPLRLQRDGLSVEKYPFASELLDSVLRDFMAWSIVVAPADPADMGEWVRSGRARHPLVHISDVSRAMLLPFWVAPAGWVPMDVATFDLLGPERLFVALRPDPKGVGMSIVRFGQDYLLSFDVSPDEIQGNNAWLRFCLGGWSSGLGPLSSVRARAGAVMMTRAWYDRVQGSREIAQQFLSNVTSVRHSNEWTLLVVGGPNSRELEGSFDSLANLNRPRGSQDGFAELEIETTADDTRSRLMELWVSIFGRPFLPFKRSTRKRVVRDPDVTSYVEAYRRLTASGAMHSWEEDNSDDE